MPRLKNGKSRAARGTGKNMPKKQTVPNVNSDKTKGPTIVARKRQTAAYKKADRRSGNPGGAEAYARKKGTHKTFKY